MKVIKGDIIELALRGEFDVIVHGCNCFHTMGGGIALQIATIFPEALKKDRTTAYGSKDKLGDYSSIRVVREEKSFTIVNGYTQYSFGGGEVNVDYLAIQELFKKIAKDFSGLRIAYPKIGAGLAGGDWNVIKGIICEELKNENHTYIEYEPKIRRRYYEDF
jgi:O-acetyl-ADP-ribose deacetylase (regulator of RNase III)